VICFTIAIITFTITVIIWKRFWRSTIPKLTEPKLMSINDILIMLIVLTDFFQFMAVGPDFSSLSGFIMDMSHAFSVDMSNLVAIKEGFYWIILEAVLVICFIWALLCLMIVQKIDIRFERVSICKNLGLISDNVLPILGNAGFLPIISILLDVYICDEAVGDKPL
jgi:hypothetical protein